MADELLPYYEKELAFIRQMGASFAKEHPKVAGRLGISSDTIEDPHVSRLIEAFAYLNARIQHKLDDDIPEFSDALLSVLFPHYQRPIPSMSIVQFVPDKDQLESRYLVKRRTLLETEHFQGESCCFSTVFDTELVPISVADAQLQGIPFSTPGSGSVRGAAAVLKITLRSFNDLPFTEIGGDSVRFYLKGQPQHIHPLYELMLRRRLATVATLSEDDTSPVFIKGDCVKAVGFASEDALLPYPPSSFTGYRILTEFFVFPEKFMFIDIDGLADVIANNETNELHLYFYFDRSDVELEHNISAESFLLGCSPVVNLFEQDADPIKIDHSQEEYLVLPDVRRPVGFEVYSIDSVTASSPEGETTAYLPFYGVTHKQHENTNYTYWLAMRRHAKLSNYERDDGTDVFITLVDLQFNPNIPDNKTLHIKTTCSNRDLPAKLPFNMEHPKLQCVDAAPPCERIRCLVQPTRTVRPPLRNHARWRLISHLNLNYLSLTGRDEPTTALKEILRLYDFKDSSVTRALVESIVDMNVRLISAPLAVEGRATMCRGFEVEITLDDSMLTGSSAYLFASVLEHFFGLYCSINSFSRVLVKIKDKEGWLKKCPPRAGEKVLL